MSNGDEQPGWRERFLTWLTAGVILAGTATGAVLSVDEPFEWGLHIVFLSVGQADAIVMVAPDGDAAVIDAGLGSTAAGAIAGFLTDGAANGVGDVRDVKLGFVTHYDADHVGGWASLEANGITFESVYDQGPSLKRAGATKYEAYLEAVGDLNDNMLPDDDAEGFVRKRARPGLRWKLGEASVRVLSVRGDTRGSAYDLEGLDPSRSEIDENPGSIALLVSLGDFELYTAGDQTSDDWKHEPDTEMAVVRAGVLGDDSDIDVYKVSHHGSDTSNGREFIDALDPEVAVISAQYRSDYGLPKLVAIQQLVNDGALVYVTGNGQDPTGRFTQSAVHDDDDYVLPAGAVINDAGDVHVLVSRDGRRYRVFANGEWREFSAVDAENVH